MRVARASKGVRLQKSFLLLTAGLDGVDRTDWRKVRKEISLAGVPHLMTTSEAHAFLFHPSKLGKSVRVDFTRITASG